MTGLMMLLFNSLDVWITPVAAAPEKFPALSR